MKNDELNRRVFEEIVDLKLIAEMDGIKRMLDTVELIKDLCKEVERLESDI
jgi:hypothetical protein